MTDITKLILLGLAFLLGACGSSSGSGTPQDGAVSVSCVTISNNDTCADSSAAAIAAVSGSAGSVSRGSTVWLSTSISNGTAQSFSGYYEFRLNPGCNGESNWTAAAFNVSVNSGEAFAPAHSIQCASMPLGEGSMSFVLYEGNARTVCQTPEEIDPDIGQQCVTTPGGQEVSRGSVTYNVTS